MTGVVLCGGQSERMGFDKGLLLHESISWVDVAIQKLFALHLPVVVSVNESQYDTYSKKLSEKNIVKDSTALDVKGPLKGILSVHLSYATEDLLVLACDMVSMQKVVLLHLLHAASQSSDHAIAFTNDSFVEPLCAVYTAKGLKKILELYEDGKLVNHSLHHALGNIQTRYLTIPNELKDYFRNYNSPVDLNSL